MLGIDHIPLVVRDLERAADQYRSLGFAIKPGRFHFDGIRNSHVKFADGAGIELITAPAATDPVTSKYVQLLSQGEGPASVSFHTASLAAVQQHLDQMHVAYSVDGSFLELSDPALDWLFVFEGNNLSPTDKPEYFNHPNGANATLGVWIAGGDRNRMLAFFKGLGARIERQRVYVPDQLEATVARVANGEVIFLPQSRQIIPGRPIVGVIFRVNDLPTARRRSTPAAFDQAEDLQTPTYRSAFIKPENALGVWLELREIH